MFGKKVYLILVVAAIALAFEATTRAQSPTASRDEDPVVSARERIESAVERRAAIAERVLAASKLLNESIAARKRGERERATAQLQQAEAIANEIAPSERSYLLDALAPAIAAERAALSPGQPAVQTPLSSEARKVSVFLRPALARYSAYRESLTRILREENLPPELLAVALVESGFNPLALSRKGARGIWQFMPATAERYGLLVQPGADHRIHPEHSTRAAARYLRDLYRQFGDWKLALAAYNWGEDKVQRVINRTGVRDFDELTRRGLLPIETRKYVPAVLAVWGQLSNNSAGSRLRKDE
jgi:soluble lytic murein transglycosylase-like protein